ncbi:hypothetical protein AVEN_127795-1 [Araneus ventricosus]|uniref:Uncharacterized protein n=1 Tax=Araneus ventricosus TaxID=182803 RepID=A0A4Y2DRA2_ARAVE|nr:hypothetical protein AVEN_127795-1 [Araneus ventricosus]
MPYSKSFIRLAFSKNKVRSCSAVLQRTTVIGWWGLVVLLWGVALPCPSFAFFEQLLFDCYRSFPVCFGRAGYIFVVISESPVNIAIRLFLGKARLVSDLEHGMVVGARNVGSSYFRNRLSFCLFSYNSGSSLQRMATKPKYFEQKAEYRVETAFDERGVEKLIRAVFCNRKVTANSCTTEPTIITKHIHALHKTDLTTNWF